MYAVAATWTMDSTRAEEHRRALNEMIVPRVKSAPGFVSSYFTYNLTTGKSYGFTILESEEAAIAFVKSIEEDAKGSEAHGVRLDTVGLAEVVAKA